MTEVRFSRNAVGLAYKKAASTVAVQLRENF